MTNKVLGGGIIDGALGVNPDFSEVEAGLGRILTSVSTGGYLQYWIVEETQKAGGNLLANGLYANTTTLQEVGGDTSQLRQAIEAVYKAQGYNNIFFFEDGFTYTESNDVGVYEDGTAWTYADAGALPVTVAAGTVPSVAAGYQQVTFNSASGVLDSRGTNVQDYIDGNLTPFKTVADMKAAAYLSTLPEFTRIEWQGYYAQSDGGGNWGVLRFGAHTEDGGSIFSIDANTYIEANLKGKAINPKKFGVKADGLSDDSGPLARAVVAANTTLKSTVKLPNGTLRCDNILDLSGLENFKMVGQGKLSSVLYFPVTGQGIVINQQTGFLFGTTLRDFGVQGNPSSGSLILINNAHHMDVANINLKEGSSSFCYALDVRDSVASNFTNITCSTNEQPMASRIYSGIRISSNPLSGSRATNNTFINPCIEGTIGDGIVIDKSDLNTFIGGTSENNDANGVSLTKTSRMNTFIGMGFENRGFADVYDDGDSSKFINCYSSKMFYAGPNSRFGVLDGGIWERVEIDAGADHYEVKNIDHSYWTSIGVPNAGGLFDNSPTTKVGNIFNSVTVAQEYPSKPAESVTATASPFTWDNSTGVAVEFFYKGSGITQAVIRRGGSAALNSSKEGGVTLKPGDGITISYTGETSLGYLPLNLCI